MAVVVVTTLHNIKPITDPVVFIVFILLPCFHSSSLFFPLLPSSSLFSGAKDIPRFKIRALQPFLCNPSFVPGPLRGVSAAAAALCAWALQIVRSRPQYMEWLGAVGAAALRAKTPSSPRGRMRQQQQQQQQQRRGRDDDEESYGSGEWWLYGWW